MTNGPDHPLRVLVAVSRPIAQEIAVEHHGQIYQAISPIPWPPVQVVRDGLDAAAEAGATAVIQPGGSDRDFESIEACNAANVAMVFTGQRSFKH